MSKNSVIYVDIVSIFIFFDLIYERDVTLFRNKKETLTVVTTIYKDSSYQTGLFHARRSKRKSYNYRSCIRDILVDIFLLVNLVIMRGVYIF